MVLSYVRFKVATKHRQLHPGGGFCQQRQSTVNTNVFSPSSWPEWPQTTQWAGFLWLSGQKPRLLKCLGFKNGRTVLGASKSA